MQTKLNILSSAIVGVSGVCVLVGYNFTGLIFFIAGILLYLAAFLSKDRKDQQIEEIHAITTSNDKIDHLKEAIKAHKQKGTPKYYIDTLEHLSMEEKAKLYDDAVMASRGRPAKNNAYKS